MEKQVKTLHIRKALRIMLLGLLLSVAGSWKTYAQNFTLGGLNYSVNEDGASVTVTGTAYISSAIIGESFENGIPSDWVTIDADGDGNNWGLASWANHSGDNGVASASYLNGAVTPDNYLVSGQINFTSNLGICFYACAYDAAYASEHFGVAVSTGSQTNAADFITIAEWMMTAKENGGPKSDRSSRDQCTWHEYTVDLSSYAGQTGYVAIRHFDCTDQWYLNVDDIYIGEETNTSYYIIPESVSFEGMDYLVTAIGDYAFFNCNSLTSIELPNSITSIGDYAFWGCSSLTSIELSNSLTIIGDYAFYYCSSLTSIELPDSLTSIGSDVFSWCGGLTSVTIGNSVTSIGNNAFSNCSGLTSMTIPNSVTSIESGAFYGCSSLTSIELSNSVTFIGNGVFCYCGSLTSIEIPNSVTSIGDETFSGCIGLTSIEIPNSVTSIGDGAFSGCKGLTSVTIPNSVTSVGSDAFSDCSNLASLEIPESVISIGNYAFSRCYGLISVTIPSTVTSIGEGLFNYCSGLTSVEILAPIISVGDYAFEGCNRLMSLVVLAETPPSFGSDSFDGVTDAILVYVPAGSLEAYTTADWGGFSNFLPISSGDIIVSANPVEGGVVTGSGYYEALQTCTLTAAANEGYVFANWTVDGVMASRDTSYSFTVCGDRVLEAHFVMPGDAIVFADSHVKAICVAHWDYNGDGELGEGEAAAVRDLGKVFYGDDIIASFDELQYFTGLTSIGENAFYGCSSLTSLVIPNAVTSIDEGAFGRCIGLTSVSIPDFVVSIGDWAFYSCSGLNSVLIPNTVTSIGEWAFFSCSSLTSMVIPNSVTFIGDCAFSSCSGLTSIQISNSISSIGNFTFRGCSGLTSIEIPNTVTSIGEDAFGYCSSLVSIEIPNSVTSIGNDAFYGCSGFTGSLTIPISVTSIGNYAFSACSGLTSVSIPNSVTTIGSGAFKNCGGLTGTLTIPNSVTSIETSVFYGCSSLTSIELPNSVTFIGNYAFYDCSSLTSIEIPSSVISIGDQTFYNCSSLTSIELPNSVAFIGNYAFYNCSSLTSIEIPSFVTSIGDRTFYNCSGLTSIEIPSSVTSIGDYAFSGCRGLTFIMVMANTPPVLGNYAIPINRPIPVYVPCGSEEAYTSINWGGFRNIYGLCSSEITVTANPAEGGTVTGAGYFDGGATCTLTATANEGYTFVSWMENGQKVSSEAEYAFIVCQDRNLVAHFSLPLTITVTANPTEGGMVLGGGEYNYGSTCTITATANEGFCFNSWWKDGIVVSTYDTYSFTVTASDDYVAVFDPMPDGVYVGDGGTATNEYLPSYSYYNYSLSQQIYTAEEIGCAGSIKSVAFFNGGATRTRSYDIYMVSTEKTVFENTNDWIPVTGNDLVFGGQVTMNANEWTTLQFETPFQYDGLSNIALIVDDNTGDWAYGSQMACRVFETQGNQAIRVYEDSPNYDPYNPSGYTGTLHSVKNQIILGFMSLTSQMIELSSGWNWISTYIDLNEVNGITMLEEALGDYGVTIQTYNESADYFGGGEWSGLEDYVWTNAEMVMVEVSEDCTIALAGPTVVDPSTVEIEIHPGWNWIGFPVAAETAIGVAMSGFEAEEEDAIQSNVDGTSDYLGEWLGDVLTLVPGQGYMYYSNSTEPKTLIFSTTANGKSVITRKGKE